MRKTISTPSIAIDNDSKQAKVFLAFKYYYGTLWLSQLEDTTYSMDALKSIWTLALKELSKQQVDDGVKKIMMGNSKFSSYPPKPGEFVELCKEKEHKAYYGPMLQLSWDKKRSTKEVASHHMQQIREKLGIRRAQT